ncbi:MAG: hypothetical protein J7M08_00200 [Planctomycetes bacterium]|nr:hypothetical protein [Planctomycetota bacterium]
MTLYIAAYDAESPEGLAAPPRIVETHRRFRMPATFFLVDRLPEAALATAQEEFAMNRRFIAAALGGAQPRQLDLAPVVAPRL